MVPIGSTGCERSFDGRRVRLQPVTAGGTVTVHRAVLVFAHHIDCSDVFGDADEGVKWLLARAADAGCYIRGETGIWETTTDKGVRVVVVGNKYDADAMDFIIAASTSQWDAISDAQKRTWKRARAARALEDPDSDDDEPCEDKPDDDAYANAWMQRWYQSAYVPDKPLSPFTVPAGLKEALASLRSNKTCVGDHLYDYGISAKEPRILFVMMNDKEHTNVF